MQEQFECDGRRDCIGQVGNAQVEKRKLGFQRIRLDNLELALEWGAHYAFLHLRHHALVHLDGDDFFGGFKRRLRGHI